MWSSSVVGWLAVLALVGCKGGEGADSTVPPRYDEPVGVRVEGAHLPPYQLIIATNEGVRAGPLVSVLTSLVHRALLACSAPSDGAPADITLSFAVHGGGLVPTPAEDEQAPTTRAMCVRRGLTGNELGDAAVMPQRLLLQLRFGSEAGP